MFDVVGERKDVLKKAVRKFVLDTNEHLDEEGGMMAGAKDKIKKLEKVPGVNTKDIRKKLDDLGDIRFSMEEIEDGWEVVVPGLSSATDIPVLGKSFKGFIGQSLSALDSALSKMWYCPECDEIKEEEDKCSECGTETEDFEYKVK